VAASSIGVFTLYDRDRPADAARQLSLSLHGAKVFGYNYSIDRCCLHKQNGKTSEMSSQHLYHMPHTIILSAIMLILSCLHINADSGLDDSLCSIYLYRVPVLFSLSRSKLIPLRIAIDGEEIGVLTSGYYYTIPKLPGKLRIDVLLGNSASVDTISLIIEAGKDYYFRIRQYSRSSASIDYIPNSLGITESAGCKLAGELPQQPKIEAEKAPEIAATTYQLVSCK
jgi:hypothetical protein